MSVFEMVNENIGRLKIPFEDIFTTVFLIKTEEGAVLFDTATYPTDADEYIVPALKAAGVDANSLAYIVISHSHRDHAGGLARLLEIYPDVTVVGRSEKLRDESKAAKWIIPDDETEICGVLRTVMMTGHSPDSMGVIDTRTKTLVSGDSLQLYGIFGSGKWGANIPFPTEHFSVLDKLRSMDIESVFASHDYHSLGWRADGREAVLAYLNECAQAIYDIRDFMGAYQQLDDSAIAEMYNSASGKPRVGERIFKAVRVLL